MATKLEFSILDSKDCKSIWFADTSVYQTTPDNTIICVTTPFSEDKTQLFYTAGGFMRLNSSNLGITPQGKLDNLPDGLYKIRMSVDPNETLWYEKLWFRTCMLECKFAKAVMKLGLAECKDCYDKDLREKIDKSWLYIMGIKGATGSMDLNKAQSLYKTIDGLLNKIVGEDCKCS